MLRAEKSARQTLLTLFAGVKQPSSFADISAKARSLPLRDSSRAVLIRQKTVQTVTLLKLLQIMFSSQANAEITIQTDTIISLTATINHMVRSLMALTSLTAQLRISRHKLLLSHIRVVQIQIFRICHLMMIYHFKFN